MQIQFDHNETQQMLAQSAQKLAQAGLDAAGFAAQLADLGFCGVLVAEDAGGFGGDMQDVAAIMEPFGHGLAPDTRLLNAVICGPLLAGHADILAGIIDGTRQVALAVYEAGQGYDVTPISTRYEGSVSGRKLAVVGGDCATDLIVSACGPKGTELLLVASDAAGVMRHAYAMPDGRGACDVTFTNAPATRLDPAGLDAAMDRATLSLCAEAQGVMAAAIALSVAHLTTRQQFGRPLGKFQVLQARLADMAIAVQQARSAMLGALAAMPADAHARAAAVSAAKVLADKAAVLVGEGAIQLHGAIGITEEHQIGHIFRRLTTQRSLFGDIHHHLARFSHTTDIQRSMP